MSDETTQKATHTPGWLEILFDGPPSHQSGRFVEAEIDGQSVSCGEWIERDDGLWALSINPKIAAPEMYEALRLMVVAARNDQMISRVAYDAQVNRAVDYCEATLEKLDAAIARAKGDG